MVRILNHMKQIHTLTSHLLKSNLILYFHLCLRLGNGLFPPGCQTKKIYMHLLLIPCVLHVSPISPWQYLRKVEITKLRIIYPTLFSLLSLPPSLFFFCTKRTERQASRDVELKQNELTFVWCCRNQIPSFKVTSKSYNFANKQWIPDKWRQLRIRSVNAMLLTYGLT